MSDTPDFHELVGDDLTPEEELALLRVDGVLRSVPGPATEVPGSLTRAVEQIGRTTPFWTRRRAALAVALAAALAAIFFGIGRWGDRGFEPRETVKMEAQPAAPQASGQLELGWRDDSSGNWKLHLVVDGLPHLDGGEHYVLWLAKDGKYAGACGTFDVDGRTSVEMTASYDLSEYDEWVISKAEPDSPWLLAAKT